MRLPVHGADGRIVRVNRDLRAWTGLDRADLVGAQRFPDLLSAGGGSTTRPTTAPLLRMQGWVREIAVDFGAPTASALPALVNSVLRRDAAGEPRAIRMTVFDATDRRRYEEELLRARNREHEIARRLQASLLDGELPRRRAPQHRHRLPPRGRAGFRSAATGTTPSRSRRTASRSWSATSSAAVSRRPPPWGSCAAPSAPWPRPASPPERCSAPSTRTPAATTWAASRRSPTPRSTSRAARWCWAARATCRPPSSSPAIRRATSSTGAPPRLTSTARPPRARRPRSPSRPARCSCSSPTGSSSASASRSTTRSRRC